MTEWELRSQKLKELGFDTYQDYLLSPHWREIKSWWRSTLRASHTCWCCNRKHIPIELHHRSYENLGAEKEGDLVGLCRMCHELTHELIKSKVAGISFWNACKVIRSKLRKRLSKGKRRGYEVGYILEKGARKIRSFIERKSQTQQAKIGAQTWL